MKKVKLFVCIFLFLACEEVNDPENIVLSSYSFSIYGQDQIADADSYLRDHIAIQAQNYIVNNSLEDLTVQFDVIKGGGMIDPYIEKMDSTGYKSVSWKLGDKSCEQIVNANVIDQEGRCINTSSIIAYGMRDNEWNRLPLEPHVSIDDMVYDSDVEQTFMISKAVLYKQGESYYNWDEVGGLTMPRTIDMDSNQNLYVGTWSGELFKSMDHGDSWIKCTNPIKNYSGYFEFYITSDNCLWATCWEHGLYYSSDGGITWDKDSLGIENQEEMLDVYLLNNGTLVSLSRNRLVILKSEDKGKTWEEINTPLYTIKIFVTENNELIAINQDNGITMYKSVDLGETYKAIFNTKPAWGISPMKNNFQKYDGVYYIAIPGDGIFTTTDFETFNRYWSDKDLKYLFLDHNGVLVAVDWEKKGTHYKKNTE